MAKKIHNYRVCPKCKSAVERADSCCAECFEPLIKRQKEVYHNLKNCPACNNPVESDWVICIHKGCNKTLIDLSNEKSPYDEELVPVGQPGRRKSQERKQKDSIKIFDDLGKKEQWGAKLVPAKKKKNVRPRYNDFIDIVKAFKDKE